MKLQTLFRGAVLATLVATTFCAVGAPYTFTTYVDGPTGNTEYRFMDGSFHWGTLISDPAGRLIFRPHPDESDVNGFGSSWYMSPFLAGADPRGGVVSSIGVGANGIAVNLAGPVPLNSTAGFGSWTFSGTFAYEVGKQKASAAGVLDVTLDAPLATIGLDLNLDRIASNYLHAVPLQGGGVGDTGDMSAALVRYTAGSDPRNFLWQPVAQPAHFPTDASSYLGIDSFGTINNVDTLALGEGFQIAVARKPSLDLTFVSESELLSAGLFWDATQGMNFALDNIGMNHLVLWPNDGDALLHFDVSMSSTSPIPEPAPFALMLAGLGMLVYIVRRRSLPAYAVES